MLKTLPNGAPKTCCERYVVCQQRMCCERYVVCQQRMCCERYAVCQQHVCCERMLYASNRCVVRGMLYASNRCVVRRYVSATVYNKKKKTKKKQPDCIDDNFCRLRCVAGWKYGPAVPPGWEPSGLLQPLHPSCQGLSTSVPLSSRSANLFASLAMLCQPVYPLAKMTP